MSGTVGVVVRLPEREHARLRAEAGRTGTTVPGMLQRAALTAAAALPDPGPRRRRTLREVLRSRVEEMRLAGLDDDEIAGQLQIPLERVQAVQ